jgi:hypothetical protein
MRLGRRKSLQGRVKGVGNGPILFDVCLNEGTMSATVREETSWHSRSVINFQTVSNSQHD